LKILKNNQLSLNSKAILCAILISALLFNVTMTSRAAAETGNAQMEADDQITEITVEAPRPDWESELSPGTVTVIRPDDYQGEQKTLPELLKDVPGVHVRYVSGKGGYTTVSVRGSTAAQVGVFADGVLVNLGGDAAVDLSTIPVKNIERIEVYRGYIPARFGGAHMGGVVNIVTKKPQKSEVSSASVGAGSYGGFKANLEVNAPLGGGSLLAGFNHEQSKGDFPYTNPGSDAAYAKWMPGLQTELPRYINATNNALGLTGIITNFTTVEEVNAAFDNPEVYNQYLTTFTDNYYSFLEFPNKEAALTIFGWSEQQYTEIAKQALDQLRTDLNQAKENTLRQMQNLSKDPSRQRRNNDYQNSDTLIKWQDGHWTVKGIYKHIERGLPQNLLITGNLDTIAYSSRDLPGSFERMRQEITSVDLLVGRRATAANLEWGWNLNYLYQDKLYRNPDYHDPVVSPLAEWSEFDSRRLGGALDGAYKAGEHHMLEFLANWSREAMDVDGSDMERYDMSDELINALRFRTYFEQTLCNIQLQDTVTLNRAGDCWFTPGIRYNSSEVMGRAAGPYRAAIDENHRWVKQEDRQQNAKTTWQLALKKRISRQLTLQSTYGTYYRLLNLYEIAGDGAGILPRPNTGADAMESMFPTPEEGTQWDLAAVWDGNLWGSVSSNLQLTYFGRKSENLLQLYRFGYDYWSYTNSAKGRVQGLEFQAGGNWKKWDLNLSGTWMWERKAWARNPTPVSVAEGADYYMEQFYTYTPEWEGALRLTFRPGGKISVFSELKYEGEMYCWAEQNEADGIRVLEALTTAGLGAKYRFHKDFQATAGVNDLFDRGPGRRVRCKTTGASGTRYNYYLSDYPLQGRTYYLTLQYKY
jgi:vitamin B12 transporter